jgi:hypothetical protein
MRTAILALGWVAAGLLFLYARGQARHQRLLAAYNDQLARLSADTCHDCATVVGRLSAELATETRRRAREQTAADYYTRVAAVQRHHIEWQEGRIDQLEHEQAIDGGTTLAAEAEQWLQGGGS